MGLLSETYGDLLIKREFKSHLDQFLGISAPPNEGDNETIPPNIPITFESKHEIDTVRFPWEKPKITITAEVYDRKSYYFSSERRVTLCFNDKTSRDSALEKINHSTAVPELVIKGRLAEELGL